MSAPQPARLADVADLLSQAGYSMGTSDLAGATAVIGESPYALIACVEFDAWDCLEERIFDVQAALTRAAADAPSARNWDLYVVALVAADSREHAHRATAERIESDTRYARKFVRAGVHRHALDRALRPLLPLRQTAQLKIASPLSELRNELRALEIADVDADTAIESFCRSGTVELA